MKEAIEIAKRFVIIANGEMTDYQWHRRLLRDDDFLVCADGGARHALGMGVIPDVVLGDFDSLSLEVRLELTGSKCRWETLPCEKDATDTEVALLWSLQHDPAEILFLGGLGTRWDHSLANIFLLVKIPAAIPAKIVDQQNEIYLLRNRLALTGLPGDCVSILPLAMLMGVSTRGLKYILQADALDFGSSRGVSNEFVRENIEVAVQEGWALVIQAWDLPRS